jgi:hypothetical protein
LTPSRALAVYQHNSNNEEIYTHVASITQIIRIYKPMRKV